MPLSIRKAVLVPFDFSDPCHVAVDKAIEISSNNSQIHVLHVLAPFVPLAPEGMPIEWVDDSKRVTHAKEMLAKEFSDERYSGIKLDVLVGDPGTVCVEQAEALDAELIVVPSHGRHGLTRLLLGSVAERIVRLAKCPVLMLKI